jgi:hypothetical protein
MRVKLKTIKNINFNWMMKLKIKKTLTNEPKENNQKKKGLNKKK